MYTILDFCSEYINHTMSCHVCVIYITMRAVAIYWDGIILRSDVVGWGLKEGEGVLRL